MGLTRGIGINSGIRHGGQPAPFAAQTQQNRPAPPAARSPVFRAFSGWRHCAAIRARQSAARPNVQMPMPTPAAPCAIRCRVRHPVRHKNPIPMCRQVQAAFVVPNLCCAALDDERRFLAVPPNPFGQRILRCWRCAGCFCQHLREQRFVGTQPLLQTVLRQPRGNADVQAAFAARAQDNVFLGAAVDVQRYRVTRQRINQRLHQRLLRPPKPKLRVLLYPLLVLR